MTKKSPKLSDKLYKQFIDKMPIICVDMIIKHKNEFLLCKRKNEPAKGTWCYIGGRVLKGEDLEKATIRKAKEEAGLNVKIKEFLGVEEMMFGKSAFGVPTHTVAVLFLVEATSKKGMKMDSQSSDLRWHKKINKSWPSYVKEWHLAVGFKY